MCYDYSFLNAVRLTR